MVELTRRGEGRGCPVTDTRGAEIAEKEGIIYLYIADVGSRDKQVFFKLYKHFIYIFVS